MIQEIITYIIVILAIIHTIRGLIRLFKSNSTSACATGNCGCGGKSDLFKEIKKGKKPYIMTQNIK